MTDYAWDFQFPSIKDLPLLKLADSKPGYYWSQACNAWLPNSIEDTYTKEHYESPYTAPIVGAHIKYNYEGIMNPADLEPTMLERVQQSLVARLEGRNEGGDVVIMQLVDKIVKKESKLLMLSEEDHDTQCHARAKGRGQKTFTLTEQDLSTPEVICEWIKCNIHTCPLPKLQEALDSAYRIAQESKVIKKHAD